MEGLCYDTNAQFCCNEDYWFAIGWLSNQWNAVIRFTKLGEGYLKVYVPPDCVPRGLAPLKRRFGGVIVPCDSFVRHVIAERYLGCNGRQDYYRIRDGVPVRYMKSFLNGTRY